MAKDAEPLIIYIPGLMPKPVAEVHRQALLDCLVEGIHRIDAIAAADLRAHPRCFDLVSWTYDFYGEYSDFSRDEAAVAAVLRQKEASDRDIAEAVSWKRRLLRAAYKAGDRLPFLIPRLANEKLELHLHDLRRYNRNENDIADYTRRLLKVPLEAAAAAGRDILLIAHSMGSVIAYDALWQLSRREQKDVIVDLLITMGSPLGQSYIQERLQGYGERGEARYPDNVRRWVNISAIGEMTALDRELKNDFGEMVRLGLVSDIEDFEVFNYFRLDDALNVHAEYGYLVNEATARQVRDWWCERR